jgi:hypothetical protein
MKRRALLLDLPEGTARAAYHAGWQAQARGAGTRDNPHHELEPATAWSLGFFARGGALPDWLIRQARHAGLLAADGEAVTDTQED